MIKEFTVEKDGNIKLTPAELKKLLDEAYWEGYNNASLSTYTYRTPSFTKDIYTITCGSTCASTESIRGFTTSSSANKVTLTNAVTSSLTDSDCKS